jgi:hypothetical protein
MKTDLPICANPLANPLAGALIGRSPGTNNQYNVISTT